MGGDHWSRLSVLIEQRWSTWVDPGSEQTMPAGRVLSSEQAKTAITQMQSIINGGLTNEINNLNTQGTALSDPNNWDGPLAERFRSSTWPETKSALDKAKVELEQLRGQLQQISSNIMTAGGGS
jgi:uncharacterized protein YukE